MLVSMTNYFSNLNSVGQALFVVGVLLIITFIVLLIVVFKPEKNKVKKIYGENQATDRESIFEEKMKDIDNIGIDDINIDNDITRNLKNIVDELKQVDSKQSFSIMDRIEAYEDEQEDTAIISVEELLKVSGSLNSRRGNLEITQVYRKPIVEETFNNVKTEDDDFFMEDISEQLTQPIKVIDEKKSEPAPRREIFSSVYADSKDENNNEAFLSSLKQFRSNL